MTSTMPDDRERWGIWCEPPDWMQGHRDWSQSTDDQGVTWHRDEYATRAEADAAAAAIMAGDTGGWTYTARRIEDDDGDD